MQATAYIRIPLVRRDGSIAAHALVDDEDAHLAGHRWHVGSHGYARRNEGTAPILMHRVILGLDAGDDRHCDHVNRDRLDNRRANLRIVSRAENQQNKPGYKNASSVFRGVSWDAQKGIWRARGVVNRQRFHLGYHQNEVLAACAVEAWRRENMPFAQPDPELMKVMAALSDLAA